MNATTLIQLPVELLIYLASIAMASLIAGAIALIVLRLLPAEALPVRHAVAIIAMIVALVSPLLVSIAQRHQLSPFRLSLASDQSMVSHITVPTRENSPRATDWSRTAAANLSHSAEAAGSIGTSTNAPAPAARPPRPETASASQLHWSWMGVVHGTASGIAWLWLAGIAVGMWRLLADYRRLNYLMRDVQPVSDVMVDRLAAQAAGQLGLAVVPPIRQATSLCAPLSMGVLRPLVVLPAAMERLYDSDQVRGMLLHELAHIARRDHVVGLVQRAVLIGFWWNPLLQLLSAQISSLREQICDDLATAGADSAEGYASMLVELAGRATAGQPLPATIGIFESPVPAFSHRVRRLLDGDRSMVTRLDRRMKYAIAGILIVIVAAIMLTTVHIPSNEAVAAGETLLPVPEVQPPRSEKAPEPADSDAPAVHWPDALRGVVKDSEGKPIAGARVRLDVEKIYEFSIGRLDQKIHSETLTTDESGAFRFEISGLPKMAHRPFSITLSATADGYSDAKWWNWHSRRDTTVDEHLADITMQPGRLVRGRCVDPQGRAVAGAVVKFASDHVRNYAPSAWAWDARQTNQDGEFEVSVPRDGERAVELWVAHPDFAPQHAVVPKIGTELADIRMKHGSRVRGYVRYEDGTPVPGTVVAASSIFDGNLDMVTFPARVAVRTDATGRYELPPLEGMYKVFLSQAEVTEIRLEDQFVVAKEPPPLVVPRKVSLSGVQEEIVNFESGPTLTVRGTARWPDGRPVEDMEVRASYLPSGFGTGIELGTTHTNKLGQYSFEVPKPIEQLSITASGKHDDQRTWYYAEAENTIAGDYVHNKGLQFIWLKELSTDVGGMDWVLRADLPE